MVRREEEEEGRIVRRAPVAVEEEVDLGCRRRRRRGLVIRVVSSFGLVVVHLDIIVALSIIAWDVGSTIEYVGEWFST